MSAHLRDEELLEPPSTRTGHLAACHECGRRRDAQVAIREALRALPREAAMPDAGLAVLSAHRAARVRRRRAWLVIASAAAVALAASMLLFLARSPRALPSEIVDELALDHLHYEHHADAAQVRGDPAAISAYFGETLGFSPHYGVLEAARFEGAKQCRIAGKWTALAWLDRAGHWLSLFTMPEQIARGRGCAVAQNVRVCASPDPRGGARVLVGDLPEPEMLRLVDESLQ